MASVVSLSGVISSCGSINARHFSFPSARVHKNAITAELFNSPHVYFIGTQHKSFEKLEFPDGSVVIDPFRYIPKKNHVEIIWLGTA